MRNHSPLFYIILLLITGILGMGTYYGITQYQLIQALDITYYSAKLVSSTATLMSVDVSLIVTNYSAIDANIDGYNLAVYVNGNFISNVVSSEPAYVAANDNSLLTIRVEFNPTTVLSSLIDQANLTAVTSGKAGGIMIRLAGTVSVTVRGITAHDVPVDITDSLSDLLS